MIFIVFFLSCLSYSKGRHLCFVIDPFRFIEHMFASARLFHPDCHQLVLTDQETVFPLDWPFEILRLDIDQSQPMLSRSQAWLYYIQFPFTELYKITASIVLLSQL